MTALIAHATDVLQREAPPVRSPAGRRREGAASPAAVVASFVVLVLPVALRLVLPVGWCEAGRGTGGSGGSASPCPPRNSVVTVRGSQSLHLFTGSTCPGFRCWGGRGPADRPCRANQRGARGACARRSRAPFITPGRGCKGKERFLLLLFTLTLKPIGSWPPRSPRCLRFDPRPCQGAQAAELAARVVQVTLEPSLSLPAPPHQISRLQINIYLASNLARILRPCLVLRENSKSS